MTTPTTNSGWRSSDHPPAVFSIFTVIARQEIYVGFEVATSPAEALANWQNYYRQKLTDPIARLAQEVCHADR